MSDPLFVKLAPYGRHGLQEHAPLAAYTSFRIGGTASALLLVTRLADLEAALNLLHQYQRPFLILGGGSNVLISDAGVPAIVLLNHCRHVYWPPQSQPELLVRVQSGAALAGFARASIKRRLAGLAWAVSIPGTIGGAVVGNAGAHGGCIADVLHSISLWRDGANHDIPASELDFRYRFSALKNSVRQPGLGPVVLTATFRLARDASGAEAARAAANIAHRRRTQPIDKSAGSIFKNPPGDYAGRLIEAAGLKGHRIGDASISTQHANFIINHGRATAADVVQLMNHVRRQVFARFGIVLEPEIQFIGDWRAGPHLEPLPPPAS